MYWGKEVRFRYIGGKFMISITGVDIDLSAIARGRSSWSAQERPTTGIYSLNDAKPQPLPGPFTL